MDDEQQKPIRYTGTITEIRTLERKDGTGKYQMFKLISAAHKNPPNFMTNLLPVGIAEGMSVEVHAVARRYAYKTSSGETRFSYNRAVQSIAAI